MVPQLYLHGPALVDFDLALRGTDAAQGFKKVANTTAMTCKMLLVAETKFRNLNARRYSKTYGKEPITQTEFTSTIIRSGRARAGSPPVDQDLNRVV